MDTSSTIKIPLSSLHLSHFIRKFRRALTFFASTSFGSAPNPMPEKALMVIPPLKGVAAIPVSAVTNVAFRLAVACRTIAFTVSDAGAFATRCRIGVELRSVRACKEGQLRVVDNPGRSLREEPTRIKVHREQIRSTNRVLHARVANAGRSYFLTF